MKKVIIGLAVVLSLSLLPAYSATPPKVGAACSKQGITKTFQGKKYTCIKSGRKLVWGKGVILKKATPTPSPTPTATGTPTPTPAPTPSPSETTSPTPTYSPSPRMPMAGDPPLPFDGCGYGWYYYRINNGVMERSFYPDKDYTATDSRSNVSFDPIRVKAYEAIRSHMGRSTNPPKIEYRISEDFPKDILSYLKSQLETQVTYWSDRFKPDAKVIATFTTEKDKLILNSSVTSNYNEAIGVADVYLDPSKSGYLNCGWRNGIAGAHTLWSGPNYGTIGYWLVFPSKHDGTYWHPTNLPHEITHGIQDLIWITDDNPYPRVNARHLIEGGAELFGTALGYPNIGWYNDEINRKIVDNYLGREIVLLIPENTVDVVAMLTKSEVVDNGSGSLWAYTVGFHLWEYLIANYGFDSYWDIARRIQKANSLDDAVRQSIGISKSQLYSDSAPYILKQFQIALSAYRK